MPDPRPAGLPVGGQAGRQPGSRARRQADTSRSTGVAPGRLFAVDVGALREIPLPALVVRFAFGATISVVAGLIGVLAGKAAGGVMLAAPAVLPATLTIIERHEGRGPAVTEVEGAVPGAVALIGFAGVAAASTARIPLGAALLAALATWVAVAIGGYLTLAAISTHSVHRPSSNGLFAPRRDRHNAGQEHFRAGHSRISCSTHARRLASGRAPAC